MRTRTISIITDIIFMFIIANFLLCFNEYSPIQGEVFLYIIIINYFISKNIAMDYNRAISIVLLSAIPLVIFTDIIHFVCLIIILSVISYSYKKIDERCYYTYEVYKFKRMFISLIIVTILSLLKIDRDIVDYYIISYVIMYIVLYVFLIRLLRNYKYNIVNNNIKKINTLYLSIVMGVGVVISSEFMRNNLSRLLKYIYFKIVDGMLFIISIFAKIVEGLLSKININIDQNKIDDLFNNTNIMINNDNKDIDYNSFSSTFFDKYFPAIIIIITIIIVLIIIFKFINNTYSKNNETVDYKEEKEYIYNEKSKKKNIKDLFTIKSKKEKILILYRKYMKKCINSGIEIRRDDTSLDIQKNSEGKFNMESLRTIRNIYLKAKYSDYICKDEDVEGIKSSYDRLKKDK